MGEEREAARNLKRHLTDKAGLCIVDCVRIAREVAKSAPGEVRFCTPPASEMRARLSIAALLAQEVSRQCKALEGLQNEITSTAEVWLAPCRRSRAFHRQQLALPGERIVSSVAHLTPPCWKSSHGFSSKLSE